MPQLIMYNIQSDLGGRRFLRQSTSGHHRHRHTETQTQTQTETQTQTDRQAEPETYNRDKQTNRQTDRQNHRPPT